MTLAALAGWLLAALALLILPVLAVALSPFLVSVRAASDPPRFEASVGLVWGLIPIRLAPRPARKPRRKPKKPPRPAAGPKEADSKRRRARIARALGAVPRLLGAVPRAISVRLLRLHLILGTGDPALTGEIFGKSAPLTYGTGGIRWLDLRLLPDFNTARLGGEAEAVLCIAPLRLLVPVARFAWAVFGPRR